MKRTLIIDDEADARLLIQNLIKKYFPEIGILGEAASKSEAIEKIELFRPDFIFLDINWPNSWPNISSATGNTTWPGKK